MVAQVKKRRKNETTRGSNPGYGMGVWRVGGGVGGKKDKEFDTQNLDRSI
jgi:hypothetical protein